jgi:hypothetical protein
MKVRILGIDDVPKLYAVVTKEFSAQHFEFFAVNRQWACIYLNGTVTRKSTGDTAKNVSVLHTTHILGATSNLSTPRKTTAYTL